MNGANEPSYRLDNPAKPAFPELDSCSFMTPEARQSVRRVTKDPNGRAYWSLQRESLRPYLRSRALCFFTMTVGSYLQPASCKMHLNGSFNMHLQTLATIVSSRTESIDNSMTFLRKQRKKPFACYRLNALSLSSAKWNTYSHDSRQWMPIGAACRIWHSTW